MSLQPIAVRPSTVQLRWKLPPDPRAVAARIFRAMGLPGDDGDWEPMADVTGDRLDVPDLLPWREYRFAAATISADGAIAPRKDWVEAVVVVDTDTNLPDTPQSFGASQMGGLLHFQWTPNDDGVTVGYEIRRGVWADGLLVGRTEHPWFEAPWWDPTTRTYFIAAYDGLGRYGATGQVEVKVTALPDHVLSNTFSESGGGFAGSASNTEVSGSDLVLLAVPSPASGHSTTASSASHPGWARYWHTGTYVTGAKDLGAVGLHRLEVKMTATRTVAAGLVASDCDAPAGTPERDGAGEWADPTSRGWSQKNYGDGTAIEPVDILVEIDTTPDSGGTPAWDGYRRYVPGEFYARQVRFRLTLYGDGFTTPTISALIFYHRQKNLKDEGSVSVAGSPGPTSVTFVTGFTAAPKVVATIVGGAANLSTQPENVTASGCDLRVYDKADTEVFTGTIHWIAAGV